MDGYGGLPTLGAKMYYFGDFFFKQVMKLIEDKSINYIKVETFKDCFFF